MSQREGYKKTEIGWIPEDWDVVKLEQTTDKTDRYSIAGGPFGSDLKSEHYTEAGVRVIQLQNMGDGNFLNNYKIFTTEDKADELKKCNIFPGEIIIAKMANPLARACIIPGQEKRYLMCSDGIRLKADKSKYDIKFLLFSINSKYFRTIAEANGTGTTRLRIGLKTLKGLPVLSPPLPEQKKIASILTTIDDKISSIESQIQQTERLKKGLMEKLLTEGIGHTEFKDTEIGRIPKGWTYHELNDIADITRLAGYEYSEYWEESDAGDILALKGYNIGKNKIIDKGFKYISDTLSLQLKRSRLYKGDIVFPCVGSIGNAVVIKEDDKYHINQNIAKITPHNEIDSDFLVQFFLSHLCQKEVRRFNATTSQPNVLVGSLRKFRLGIPDTIEEQQKIASILSSVDDKIETLTRKKTEYQTLKKGLMAELLTGKRRVKV